MTVQVPTQPAVHCRSMQTLVDVLVAGTALTICTMAGTKMQWMSAPLLAVVAETVAETAAAAQKYQILVSIKCEVISMSDSSLVSETM